MDATQVNELIERTKAEALDRRRAAGQELRTLLLGKDKPGKSDHDRLLELCGVLGIQTEQLPDVLELVRKIQRYEHLLAEEPVRLAEHRAAIREETDLERAVGEELKKLNADADARRAPVLQRKRASALRLEELKEPHQWATTAQAKWEALVEGISHEEALERKVQRATPHGSAAPVVVHVQ